MALASGHWIDKEIEGVPPSPRYDHAITVAGNIAFLFGGVSNISTEEYFPTYLNDFYMITGMQFTHCLKKKNFCIVTFQMFQSQRIVLHGSRCLRKETFPQREQDTHCGDDKTFR